MTITISLISNKKGELQKFWKTFKEYQQVDEDVVEWIYIHNNSEDAIEAINDILGRIVGFDMSFWVQVEDEDLILVNQTNREKVINKIIKLQV